jgi:hypothetical protein
MIVLLSKNLALAALATAAHAFGSARPDIPAISEYFEIFTSLDIGCQLLSVRAAPARWCCVRSRVDCLAYETGKPHRRDRLEC